MNYGGWNNDWGGGFWWILMMTMMFAFWGGLIWVVVRFVRRQNQTPQAAAPASTNAVIRQTAQEILAGRLARGEIESDEYRQRLQALEQSPKD